MSEGQLKKIILYLNNSNYKEKDRLLSYLRSNKYITNELYVLDPEMFFKITNIIIETNSEFDRYIQIATDLYNDIIHQESDKKIYLKTLLVICKNKLAFWFYTEDLMKVYDSFDDKRLFICLMQSIDSMKEIDDIKDYIESSAFNTLSDYELYSILINKLNNISSISQLYWNSFERSDAPLDILDFSLKIKDKLDVLEQKMKGIKNHNVDNSIYKKIENIFEEMKIGFNKTKNIKSEIDEVINLNDNTNINKLSNLINKIVETNNTSPIDKYVNSLFYNYSYMKPIYNEKDIKFLKQQLKNKNVYDFICNDDHSYNNLIATYYDAVRNDNLDLFVELSKKMAMPGINCKVFNKEITKKYERSLYIDLILNNYHTLLEFIEENEVDLLIRLLSINKNFELKFDIKIINNVLKYFNENVIASNMKNLDHILEEISNRCRFGAFIGGYDFELIDNNLSIICRILNINPNFTLYDGFRDYSTYLDYFTIDELAHLTVKQQKVFYEMRYLQYDKEKIRAFVFSNKDVYIPSTIEIFGLITVEQYLSVDYEMQGEICDRYISYANARGIISSKKSLYDCKKLIKEIRGRNNV